MSKIWIWRYGVKGAKDGIHYSVRFGDATTETIGEHPDESAARKKICENWAAMGLPYEIKIALHKGKTKAAQERAANRPAKAQSAEEDGDAI